MQWFYMERDLIQKSPGMSMVCALKTLLDFIFIHVSKKITVHVLINWGKQPCLIQCWYGECLSRLQNFILVGEIIS